MSTFEERQYKQQFNTHLRNAKYNLDKLIENAGYSKKMIDKIVEGFSQDEGDFFLPGDHLVTYVFGYQRAISALEALQDYQEVLDSKEKS